MENILERSQTPEVVVGGIAPFTVFASFCANDTFCHPPLLPLDTVLSIYLGGSEGGHQSSIYLSSKLLGVWSLRIVIVVGYFARIIDWTFRCPENGGTLKTGLPLVGEFAVKIDWWSSTNTDDWKIIGIPN